MTAALIQPGDSRWHRVLRRAEHDIYHLPEYVAICAGEEGATPAAIFVEDNGECLLVPLLLRPLPKRLGAPPGWRDAVTPYGYGSPLVAAREPASALDRLLPAFRAEAARQGIISVFVRLHPLLPLPEPQLRAAGPVVGHGPTVVVDLTASEAEHWQQTRTNHRSGINRLGRQGYTAELASWEAYPEFVSVYRRTMERVGADAYYMFSDLYFDRLRTTLESFLRVVVVRSPAGDVACAGLFTACGRIVQYHLGGTAEAHLALAPSKLMFHHVRSWAKSAGYDTLHLGGGVGAKQDSLFRFKAGFSKGRASFFTWRIVTDQGRYDELAVRSRSLSGPVADAGYFPAYRAAG